MARNSEFTLSDTALSTDHRIALPARLFPLQSISPMELFQQAANNLADGVASKPDPYLDFISLPALETRLAECGETQKEVVESKGAARWDRAKQ